MVTSLGVPAHSCIPENLRDACVRLFTQSAGFSGVVDQSTAETLVQLGLARIESAAPVQRVKLTREGYACARMALQSMRPETLGRTTLLTLRALDACAIDWE